MDKEKFLQGMDTLKRGLMGEHVSRYERPQFTLYPLADILQKLTALTPEQWGAYAFSREPLRGKTDAYMRAEMTAEAVECGRKYASIIRKKYETSTPSLIAKHLEMQVFYPSFPEKTDRVLFGEYKHPDSIYIYTDAIAKAAQSMEEEGVREVLTNKLDLKQLMLAHELFHRVEDLYQDEIYTRTKKIRLWSIGPLHNDSPIYALGEIAGMAFAGELCKLPYSPFVMDVFLVYGYSPSEACGLYEEIMRLVKADEDALAVEKQE